MSTEVLVGCLLLLAMLVGVAGIIVPVLPGLGLINAAVLGCTHYPLMEKVFQDALGSGVRVLSQPNLVAESLADYLRRRPEMIGPGQEAMFLTTGKPRQVSDRATQFLRRRIEFQPAW